MTIFYYSSQSRQKEENHNYNHESQIIDVSLPSALLAVTCLMRLLAGRQAGRERKYSSASFCRPLFKGSRA